MRKLFSTLALLLALGLMLALLLPRPAVAGEDDAPALISHDDMVVVALSLIGSPYKYGGASPDTGFDCSGLVKYILGLSSPIVLPRSSAEMYADSFGHKIALKDIRKGDTVLKYGQDIGKAVADIKKGEHVHVHNLKTKRW